LPNQFFNPCTPTLYTLTLTLTPTLTPPPTPKFPLPPTLRLKQNLHQFNIPLNSNNCTIGNFVCRMDTIYLVIVISLILLAVSDLIVGVSNDAVNFLNSAFGSRVATRRTVLIIATLGIVLGTLSSSGMMEIARKGIFNPEMFSFHDIMIVFMAVMLTDILLLDLFNTFGMPTSTTVSIMFELLGASFVVAILKIFSNGDSLLSVGEYINTENATLIIAGIFLSVLIAFTLGVFVQYIARLLFTFDLNKTLKKYGPFFGAVAITMITYFLLFKGLKDSSIVPSAFKEWLGASKMVVIGTLLAFWTVVCLILVHLFKVNVLKVIVLSGTFSLAMAFAGNDLVNFIGVPLAGLQSFQLFQGSSLSPEDMNMAILGEELEANVWILFAAGIIMVLTLWFSKKARSVTETEINLARQSVGKERFKSNLLARLIVRSGIRFGRLSNSVLSDSAREKIDARFEQNGGAVAMKDQPAFDLVRASVNLMMASILIAVATSLKLPLSTTYVSFMVAMGTSLADRAWDRDSAVYRVSGVINVISGWLFTAVTAFTAAGIMAVTIYYGGLIAIIGLMVLTFFLIIRSQIVHRRLEKKKKTSLSDLMMRESITKEEVYVESRQHVSKSLENIGTVIESTMAGLETEEPKLIAKAKKDLEKYNSEYEDLTASFYYYLRKIDSKETEEGHYYLHILNHLQNISQSVTLICEKVFNHVNNMHRPMNRSKVDELKDLSIKLRDLFQKITKELRKDELPEQDYSVIISDSDEIVELIDKLEHQHLEFVKNEESSPKNSMLYLAVVLECRDVLNDCVALMRLHKK
jgi:phosphate/sulfate permease